MTRASLRFVGPIGVALSRARGPIFASALTYLVSVVVGIVLATSGLPFAVSQRDTIVGAAGSSPVTEAYQKGDRLEAALLDFGSNLGLAAVPTSITGLSVVGPFPLAAYRGWVGGVVAIDAAHRSRLSSWPDASYYLVTMSLQLAGFILTMGAGVHVGLSAWRSRNDARVRSVLGLRVPPFALKDAAWIYVAAVPFFLAGSLWEFLT